MDSVSQAVLGILSTEVASAGVSPTKKARIPAWVIGLLAGTAPDLDSFFRSATDPMFATVMHRHFTHSIFFIPFGALIVWLLLWPFFRKDQALYKYYYILCLAGFGTHWMIDVATAYGTQVLWPLTTHRFSWDLFSIVDPLITLPWIIFLVFYWVSKRKKFLFSAAVYTLIYTLFCGIQQWRGQQAVRELAETRGHQIERLRVLPSLGNSFWFHTVYLHQGVIYADGLLVRPWGGTEFPEPGTSREHFSINALSDSTEPLHVSGLGQKQLEQIAKWNWFSDGWMYKHIENPLTIGDGRYSNVVGGFQPLWVLTVDFDDPTRSLKTMPPAPDNGTRRSPFEGFERLFKR